MNGEAFDEYDEASDESFEAMDEADEAMDESDESDESFEALDEGFEAMDESDEAMDESDEASDEAIPSTMTLSARLRAAQEQARGQQRERELRSRVARSIKADVSRAAATQRDITRRIRAINVGGPARSQAIRPLQGNGVVNATLASGRSARMKFSPPLAPIGEVNRLRAAVVYNDRQQSAALATQRRAIANLARAQASAASQLAAAQVKSDKDLGERIVQSYTKLDKRISSELSGGKGIVDKNNKRIMKWMKHQRHRQLANSVLLTTALPLYAAYGDAKDPFSRDNLILTASLAGFLLADEFISGIGGDAKRTKTWTTAATAWSWLAPVGNFALIHLLLKDRQHERFVAQVSKGNTDGFLVDIPIAKDSLEDFNAVSGDVPVVATLVAGPAGTDVQAKVDQKAGKVAFTFKLPADTARSDVTVAWMVDSTLPA